MNAQKDGTHQKHNDDINFTEKSNRQQQQHHQEAPKSLEDDLRNATTPTREIPISTPITATASNTVIIAENANNNNKVASAGFSQSTCTHTTSTHQNPTAVQRYSPASLKLANTLHAKKKFMTTIKSQAVAHAMHGMLQETDKVKSDVSAAVDKRTVRNVSTGKPSTTKRRFYQKCLQPQLIVAVVVTIMTIVVVVLAEKVFPIEPQFNCTVDELFRSIYDAVTLALDKNGNKFHTHVKRYAYKNCSISENTANNINITSLTPGRYDERFKQLPFVMIIAQIQFIGILHCMPYYKKRPFKRTVYGVDLEGILTAKPGQLFFNQSTFTYDKATDTDEKYTPTAQILLSRLYQLFNFELNALSWPPDMDKCLRTMIGY